MNLLDTFRAIYTNLSQRKGRTIFTMSGVIIGCLAIFTIVSVTNGLEKHLTSSMSNLIDMTSISVYPTFEGNTATDGGSVSEKYTTLNKDAIAEIEKVPGVLSVSGKKNEYGFTKEKGREITINTESSDFTQSTEKDLLLGRLPKKEGEILISYMTAFDFALTKKEFNDGVMFQYEKNPDIETRFKKLIGKNVKLYKNLYDQNGEATASKKLKLKIVGIKDFNNRPNEWSNDVFTEDIIRMFKLDTLLDKTTLKKLIESNNQLTVKVSPDGNLEETVEEVTKQIRNLGYQPSSPLEFIKETRTMMMVVKLILGLLAGISLVVASFGIINTMEMAIYERNKEIGIMKVLGCSLRDIKKLFVLEACAISGLGGTISILLGLLINVGINFAGKNIAASMNFEGVDKIASASPSLILSILAFSILIGMLAGYKPSKKAVNIDVLSAIR